MWKKPTRLGRCFFFHWKKRWLQVKLNGHDGNEDMLFGVQMSHRNSSKLWDGSFSYQIILYNHLQCGGVLLNSKLRANPFKKRGVNPRNLQQDPRSTDPKKPEYLRAKHRNLQKRGSVGIRCHSICWWNQGLRSAGKSGFSLWCGAQLNKVYRGGAHPWTIEACLVRRWNRSMADFFGGLGWFGGGVGFVGILNRLKNNIQSATPEITHHRQRCELLNKMKTTSLPQIPTVHGPTTVRDIFFPNRFNGIFWLAQKIYWGYCL